MKKAQTLEEFIKNYVDSATPKKEKLSYEAWVSKNGINAENNYQKSLRVADVAFLKDDSGYGKSGEALYKNGLTRSGYSAYLNSQRNKRNEAAKATAFTEYVSSTAQNAKDYRSYSDDFDKKLEEQFTKIYSDLTNDKVIDYDRAYDYAKAAGLTPENASVIAMNATSAIINDLKKSAIDLAIEHGLSKEEARRYALELGLSNEDANEVAIFADSLRDRYSKNEKTQKYTKDGYPIY